MVALGGAMLSFFQNVDWGTAYHFRSNEAPMTPTRQNKTVSAQNHTKNGSFLCVNPQYSSKTLLAGKQFKRIQGKTVINHTSYVYNGTKETNVTQKYVGASAANENNRMFE